MAGAMAGVHSALLFARAFLANPHSVGAATPASTALAASRR